MAIRRCRESFCWWDANRVPHDVPAGTLVDTSSVGDWYEGRKHLFDDVETFVDMQSEKAKGYSAPEIESATAAPGEMRSITPNPEPVSPKSATTTRFSPPTTAEKEDGK